MAFVELASLPRLRTLIFVVRSRRILLLQSQTQLGKVDRVVGRVIQVTEVLDAQLALLLLRVALH